MRFIVLVAMAVGIIGAMSGAWACMPPAVKGKDSSALSQPAPTADVEKPVVKKPGA